MHCKSEMNVLAEDPEYDEDADGDYYASASDHSGAEDEGEDAGAMGGRGKRKKKSGSGASKRWVHGQRRANSASVSPTAHPTPTAPRAASVSSRMRTCAKKRYALRAAKGQLPRAHSLSRLLAVSSAATRLSLSHARARAAASQIHNKMHPPHTSTVLPCRLTLPSYLVYVPPLFRPLSSVFCLLPSQCDPTGR